MDPAGDISRRARELGFEAVGFAPPDGIKQAGAAFLEFIERGRHGDMDWLAARAGQRRSPKDLWPEVKSVIALGMNYGPATDPMKNLSRKDTGNISVYARGRDYHDVFKKRLKKLGRWMAAEYGCELKVFVDTAPVLEKPLAAAAGIGWQGKHTNLVSREYGSWLFLGAIFTTLEIAASRPHEDHCGDCRACIDACPTGALTGAYRIDPRRCISYLTIESKGAIPPEFRKAIGNRIYGCD
ncbi:MAG: tRNA epoxyqueuosine(34) reductase QueG, partial [Sphingomonadales bacterium]